MIVGLCAENRPVSTSISTLWWFSWWPYGVGQEISTQKEKEISSGESHRKPSDPGEETTTGWEGWRTQGLPRALNSWNKSLKLHYLYLHACNGSFSFMLDLRIRCGLRGKALVLSPRSSLLIDWTESFLNNMALSLSVLGNLCWIGSHKLMDAMLDYCESSLWIRWIILASLFEKVTCRGTPFSQRPSRPKAEPRALWSIWPLEAPKGPWVLTPSKRRQK